MQETHTLGLKHCELYVSTQIRLYTGEDNLAVGVGDSDSLILSGCLAYVSLQ